IWKGVNDYVYVNSHKSVETFCAYSIMDRPMTSCGCFEAICAYVPECNGIMVVNREFMEDTPVGMTFSSLAGSVGGGQQTPGFMGIGKVFITSKKFLHSEGGIKRLVWMPKELKAQLGQDLQERFLEQGVPDFLDTIADETLATDAHEVRAFMEKVGHPALEMEDMGYFAEAESTGEKEAVEEVSATSSCPADGIAVGGSATSDGATALPASVERKEPKTEIEGPQTLTPELINLIKKQVAEEVVKDLKISITKEIVGDIIGTLSKRFLGKELDPAGESTKAGFAEVEPEPQTIETLAPTAEERLKEITSFKIPMESHEVPVWKVKLGAGKNEGGTRGRTYTVGGSSCMPFHLWEGEMPHRPLVAMEVFDLVSEKYPAALRKIYGKLLENPAEMAKVCVENYGADLISVRLEGTHPEKGNRTVDQAIEVVKNVLGAVAVPLIVTGHNHFEKNNTVMKGVAQACAGENLLLNWAEQDNYRVIAGAVMAYGHSLVAQSPIDVNIAKQMNILLTNMDIRQENIVMDPMTGAAGYGLEYTYSVMERIRLTGLDGDKMLAGPLIVAPGQECAKIKEFKAEETDFPTWGDLAKRAALWETTTAVNLLYAGADILIMYHPEAVAATKRTIHQLMDLKG
ncbi:MAG: acetyl-CoA decarbonylase/synthase complex subunit delta, partial [Proteobacteria bacterium]|nr:acetyl-CoA decarbonylase/synthase complex subunit delta [Pseudomonadota bacterium]